MNEISEKVKAAGVVGAGGAGFPTHVKLAAQAEIFLVNGAECEPMLRTDQQLMAKSPELLVRGLELAMKATGAREGIIALKAKYGEAIAALKPLLAANMRIEILRDIYPAGDEVVTVWLATGRRVPPGGIPPPIGSFFSGLSAMRHSVVSTRLAIDAAFCSAERVTFAGSMMPAFSISSHLSVAALKPTFSFSVFAC